MASTVPARSLEWVSLFRVDPGEEYVKKVIVKGICHSEGNKIMLTSTQNRKGKRTCRFAIPQLVDDSSSDHRSPYAYEVEKKGNNIRHEAHDFLETIQAGYRQLNAIERQLEAINGQDWSRPEAEALRKEFAPTLAEVLTREAFIEHCRREGKAVPDLRRQQGTA